MRTIHTKLLRDLSSMRGPVLTISMVVACGICAFVTLQGTYDSLVRSRDSYYDAHRFGHVFARLERAPDTLTAAIRELPGVAHAYTRVVERARLPLGGGSEPARAEVVSIPVGAPPPINSLRLVAGRMPRPSRNGEVVLSESYAGAHGIGPGDSLEAIMADRTHTLTVVGVAMSPEYVFAVEAGAIAPSKDGFAVLWMPHVEVASLFGHTGAFNDVVLRLQPGASEPAVIAAVDRLLEPYGSFGAHGRDRQLSNVFLNQELMQLEGIATVAPGLFLAVAAFLLNVVLSRMIQLQRPQIATLKAVGYSNAEVGRHYLALAMLIVAIGTSVGLGVGAWLGRGLVELYTEFFRMPTLAFKLSPQVGLSTVVASMVAASAGSLMAVRAVTRLAPAEAMRPAAPPRYQQGWGSRLLTRLSSPSWRMVWREVSRRPLRLGLSVLGIALGVGIMVLGRSITDAMEHLSETYLVAAQREDMAIDFTRSLDDGAMGSLLSLPGVGRGEWIEGVPARLIHGPYEKVSQLVGHRPSDELRRPLDSEIRRFEVPAEGVVLTKTLADILHAGPGTMLTVEPLQGDRRPRQIRVVGTVRELLGLQGHMHADKLNALLGRAASPRAAVLRVAPAARQRFAEEVARFPSTAGMVRKQDRLDDFREQSAESMLVMGTILVVFAVVIAAGVVYNNARVTLSLRSRDLASLRVLGFTRAEISQILIGELAVQVLLAIPVGLLLGRFFSDAMMSNTDPELFRLPSVVSVRSYAFATLVTLGAAAATALVIHRKLQRLDLIAVLKTRE